MDDWGEIGENDWGNVVPVMSQLPVKHADKKEKKVKKVKQKQEKEVKETEIQQPEKPKKRKRKQNPPETSPEKRQKTENPPENSEPPPEISEKPLDPAKARRKELRSRLTNQLRSAEFRFINEQLYRSDKQQTNKILDGESAKIYHEGFSTQVKKWPVNPVDVIIKHIKQRVPKNHEIADLGCGEAKLAMEVKNKVHSFDLIKHNKRVIPCDIRKTPLEDGSVDMAVFCLSLMATQVGEFISESNRILKSGGKLIIGEVKSRIENISKFKKALGAYGFTMVSEDSKNTHFILLILKKYRDLENSSKRPELKFRPCQYKKR